MDMTAPAIEITGLNKFYGGFHALRGIDLTVAKGEKVVVCGPSGSGKSTMIRCINQLEEHDSGAIRVFGTPLDDNLASLDEIRREVGMVFQKFSLFPHMTVLENCTLAPMLVRKTPRAEAEATAMRYLEKVRIGFARKVADRVIFMDKGEIIEEAPPEEFFNSPRNERTKLFLSQVLGH